MEEQKKVQDFEYLSACGDFPKHEISEDENRYIICRKRFENGGCLMIHLSTGGADGDIYRVYDMEGNDIHDYPTTFLGERDVFILDSLQFFFQFSFKISIVK